MNYSRRCAEASTGASISETRITLAPGMEIGYVVTDAAKWDVDLERNGSEFDAG
jgi:hypothetical protein